MLRNMVRKKHSTLKGRKSPLSDDELSARAKKAADTRKRNKKTVGDSKRFLLVVPEKLLTDFKEVVDAEAYSSIGEGIKEAMRHMIRKHRSAE